jgi:hypothetical protein
VNVQSQCAARLIVTLQTGVRLILTSRQVLTASEILLDVTGWLSEPIGVDTFEYRDSHPYATLISVRIS